MKSKRLLVILNELLLEEIPTRYKKKISGYLKVLHDFPADAETYYKTGLLLSKTGEHELAIDFLSKGVSLKPNLAPAYLAIGISEQTLGHNKEALEAYNCYIKYHGKDPDVYSNIGALHYDSCQFPLAILYYKMALDINPNNQDVLFNIGEAYEQILDNELAISCFEQLTKLVPDDTEAHFKLGKIYASCDYLEAAEREVATLTELGSPLANQLQKFVDGEEVDQKVEEEETFFDQ